MAKRVLVLHSGGADSTLLLLLARELGYVVEPLLFRYGQKHVEELECAHDVLQHLGFPAATEIDLSTAFQKSFSPLLENAQDGRRDERVHWAHVPGRNWIFLGVALSVAETRGLDEVWIGCNFTDKENGFPDCSQEWVSRAARLAEVNGPYPIKVRAPLLGMTKEMVKEMVWRKGVDISRLFSGYARLGDTGRDVGEEKDNE